MDTIINNESSYALSTLVLDEYGNRKRDTSEGQDASAVALRLSISERVKDCESQKTRFLQAKELMQGVPTRNRFDFDEPEPACLYIERHAWQDLIKKTGIASVMSVKSRDALNNQLYERNNWQREAALPRFTEANIFGFMDNICANMPNMIQEAIVEVFNWLRPRNNNYKTNDEFMIGEKVVLGSLARQSYSKGFCISTYYEAQVDALGNVLSMLNGKGVMKHPQNMRNLINNAWISSDVYEGEYFTAKAFKNGNAHIKFKRMDLIEKINQSSKDLWLRQETEQKSRGFSH